MKHHVHLLSTIIITSMILFKLSFGISRIEHMSTSNSVRNKRSIIDLFLKHDQKYESCEKDELNTKVSRDENLTNKNKGHHSNDGKVIESDEIIETDDEIEVVDVEDTFKTDINENSKPSFKRGMWKNEINNETNTADEIKATSRERIKLPTLDKISLGKTVEVILPGDIETNVTVLSVSPLVIEVDRFIDDEECDLFLSITRAKSPKLLKQEINKLKLKTVKQTFGEWDYNEDGGITVDEVILLPGLSDIKFNKDDVDDMFFMLKMDKNDDKKIDLEEMKSTDFSKLKQYIDMLKSQESRKRNINSRGAWVWHDDDELLKFKRYGYFEQFHERVSAITDIPSDIIKESEPLQVKHYGVDQFQIIQQDSQHVAQHVPCCMYGDRVKCRNCRYLSYAIFLNDVEEGGEIVFPMANHKFQNLMDNSGNWRGYYIYSKTTGHKYYFQVEMKFITEGANRVFSADGNEDTTLFSFINGFVIDNHVTFEKTYHNGDKDTIKYSGKVIEATRIVGNWWVPDNKRYRGTFYMWNKAYELYSSRAIDQANLQETCPKSKLVVKPAKGKAVFWYNHHIDPRDGMVGDLHQESMTAHCEVLKGEKWIATSWINIIGDGDLELRAWRRGYNLLRGKTNIYDMLGTNESRLHHEPFEEEYLKDIEQKNNTMGDIPGYYKHKPPSNALQALNFLFNEMTGNQLKLLANTVEKKLGLQCIPLVAKHKGKVHVFDGSKA